MAVVSANKKDYLVLYQGFERRDVGLGSIDPNIYATKGYRKKKTDKLLMGGIQEIRYTGAEHDLNPLILVIGYEAAYNTVLAYNLHYIPDHYRQAIIQYVIMSNQARINSQLPLIVDYHKIKQHIPDSAKIVRRYKLQGIKIIDQYPIADWKRVASIKSKWQGWYKKNQQKSFWREVDSFFKRFSGGKKRR